ncbi:MAG: DUF3616 domain-containing protein [Cyanobacteriota bacterium]|nr:DUF3616 domain-containing protein [Cyanobacteriota bacterium]
MYHQSLISKILLSFADNFAEHHKDLSALLLTPEKHLWIGSDEASTIERLSFVDDNNFGEHKQFRVAEFFDLPASEDEEIDIEGLAYSDYYLWLIGSHSYKRKKPKPDKSNEENIKRLTKVKTEANRYIIGRIPLVNGELIAECPHPENPKLKLTAGKLQVTNQGNLLMEALENDSHLGFFVKAEIPGKDNGFDIEGIEIFQNRIFLGLRGPVLRGWAIILEIELQESNLPRLLDLKYLGISGEKYKKHFIYLNGLGIRDLCWDNQDLLILAGPTMDLDGPVTVYRLKDGANLDQNKLNYPEAILDIPYGVGTDRAEGITLFEQITGVKSLLVVHDSPAENRLQGKANIIADVLRMN